MSGFRMVDHVRISNGGRISNGFNNMAAMLSKPFENRTKMSGFRMVIDKMDAILSKPSENRTFLSGFRMVMAAILT